MGTVRNESAKWVKATSQGGRPRSFERLAMFALNLAFAEGLPFTALDCLGQARRVTHNANNV